MSKYNDTIYALSTPTGKSAIAVIRISGKKSLETLKKISTLKKIIPNKTSLCFLKFKKSTIDQVLVTFYKKPKSFQLQRTRLLNRNTTAVYMILCSTTTLMYFQTFIHILMKINQWILLIFRRKLLNKQCQIMKERIVMTEYAVKMLKSMVEKLKHRREKDSNSQI